MRYQAIASLVFGAFLASIIAAIPARARAQSGSSDAAAPGSSEAATSAPAIAPSPAPPGPPDAAASAPSPSPSPAPAPSGPPSAPGTPPRLVASLSHDLQFGLAVLIGGGYRGIFPYQRDIVCGDAKADDNRVCTNRAPVFIDVQPSFGIGTSWDVLVDVRFGLEKDFNGRHQLLIMPGFRYWLDPQSPVKFFTTVQIAYDRGVNYTPPGAPYPVSNNDLGFRNSNGLMIEIMRNFGVYAPFGETIGFLRWLSFAVDAGIGVQARVP
jgi:hypothetical protein